MSNSKKMNVLMIMTDQQHKYALGSVLPYVNTPNLDKLAKKGTLFTNAYSNNPVCSPFRGILYSGLYSKDNGVINNEATPFENQIFLADEFEKNGYNTSFVGKLHIGRTGNNPIPEEFRMGHKNFLGYQCYNGFFDDICFYDEDGVEHEFEGHRTDVTTDLGIERMRKLASEDKPFLHTIFYQAPHYPEEPSECYEKLYDGFEFPLPELFEDIDPYTPTFSPKSPRPIENCKNYKRYGNDIQEYLKLYYAMVSQIDRNVGRILDELDSLGIADNTSIIFSSDHGDMQGSHGMKNKCLPFERSCGIPLIVYSPKLKHVAVSEKPVSSVDYYPTCLEMAGFKSCKELPGKELLSLCEGKKVEHPVVFAENNNSATKWMMYRDDKYKLVLLKDNLKPLYLFDMENDVTESENLIENPKFASLEADLTKKLIEIYFKKY